MTEAATLPQGRTGWDAWQVTDRRTWNEFVESAAYAAFPQLWEWGELREAAGWTPIRLAVGPAADDGSRRTPAVGVQLLLRPIPLLGWHLAYAPRGPIGALDRPGAMPALIDALRSLSRRDRIATLRADPEVTPGERAGQLFLSKPWRAGQKVQPPRTRVVDLGTPEDELRAAMGRKHRQYINKAERDGVTIERFVPARDTADGATAEDRTRDALAEFNRIYRLTADRAGFVARDPAYYERVWRIFGPSGHVRLSFAVRGGERVATLFHFTCGSRVVESYGGMTDAGAESRANYLLKWRAICDFRAEGFKTYDMWGLATGGIEQFKAGFGGREVEYVGARDLALAAPLDALVRVALPAYSFAMRSRARLTRRTAPVPEID